MKVNLLNFHTFFLSSIKVRIFIVCLLAIKSRTIKSIFEQQEEIKICGVVDEARSTGEISLIIFLRVEGRLFFNSRSVFHEGRSSTY